MTDRTEEMVIDADIQYEHTTFNQYVRTGFIQYERTILTNCNRYLSVI